jgi:hypothetical protein
MDNPDLRPNVTAPGQPQPNPMPTLAAEPDLEAERQARIDYYKQINPKPKSHKATRITGSIVLVLLLAGAGFAAYWHFTTATPKAKSNPVAVHQAQSEADSAANQQVPTKTYASTNFQVTINYPEAWTIADTATDLAITSPMMQLTDATGAAVNGKIVMNMVPKGTLPAAFGTGATAVLNSVKVNYTQPTPTQRASTYLTFAQYAATTTTGALDGIYVTGNYGYQKDQNIPSTDIMNVDPLITVTFQKCADATCTAGLTALSIKSTDWNDATFSAPIKTLLTSLAFN